MLALHFINRDVGQLHNLLTEMLDSSTKSIDLTPANVIISNATTQNWQ